MTKRFHGQAIQKKLSPVLDESSHPVRNERFFMHGTAPVMFSSEVRGWLVFLTEGLDKACNYKVIDGLRDVHI